MQVNVSARHMNLTPALFAHAEAKLGQALMHIFDKPSARVNIELGALGHTQRREDKTCRVIVSMPRGKTIVICERDDNMYKAIDLAHDRVLERVKRERGRTSRPTRTRKWARAQRASTARQSLMTQREPWEEEVRLYESSTARL